MEGRKLQLTGGSTYVVSLPKHWVVDAGLKAGDTVFLETEPEGSVSIRPRPAEKPQLRRRIFEEKGEERRDHLLRKLIGAYIGGFNYVEIRFRPEMGPFVRRVARDFSRMVIGPEVIEETRNSVVIQDLSDTAELSAEKCLRRMHLIVRAMHEDAIEALRTQDEALARDVAQRDQDVDRLYWMVAKQYNVAHTTGGTANGPKMRPSHGTWPSGTKTSIASTGWSRNSTTLRTRPVEPRTARRASCITIGSSRSCSSGSETTRSASHGRIPHSRKGVSNRS